MKTPEGTWEVRAVTKGDAVTHGICRACFVANYPEIAVPPGAR